MSNERVALVVGAGSPLGESIAKQLAAAGWRVALNDLLPTRIEPTAATIGAQAAAFSNDLTRKLALQTMLQSILEKWERIDALIFIASVQPTTPVLDMDEWDWHRAIDANLTAAFLCMQSVGRTMRALGSGVVINIATASNGSAAFEAAAAGLAALGKAAQAEFADAGVVVKFLSDPSAAEVVALTAQPQSA